MALPTTIDPATPTGSDAASLGDDQIRALKQALIDIFGLPSATSITSAPFSMSAGGVITLARALVQPGTGGEGLRTVRGRVSTAGATINGSGFGATRTSQGDYTVAITTSFSGACTPVVCPVDTSSDPLALWQIVTIGSNFFQVRFFNSATLGLMDKAFTFVVCGPN